jgi:hypothetical protein
VLRPTRERITWLVLTVLLGLEIRFDFLRVLDVGFRQQFQSDSDAIVQTTMQRARNPLSPMLLTTGEPYESQVGLQGIVMALLSPGDRFYGAMRLTTALLAGAVLATAVVACWRAWGGRAAAVLLTLLTTSYWLLSFGASTYWQLWTLLLPTLVPMLVWPKLGTGRRKWLRGGALIAALVFLKCLCGYEYISTLLLGVAAAVAFHEFRGRFDLRFLYRLAGAITAGMVGFLTALGVHVAQLTAIYGSPAHIWQRVVERTVEPSNVQAVLDINRSWNDPAWGWLIADSDNGFRLWVFQAIHYLTSPAMNLPSRKFAGFGPFQYGLPIWLFIVVFALLALQAFRGRQADAAVMRRLAVAAGIGLLGAWSWLVLAYGHMVFHLHIDAIVFYLPFLPLVYAMIALRLQAVSLRAWPARSAAPEALAPAEAMEATDRRNTAALPPVPERELARSGAGAVR